MSKKILNFVSAFLDKIEPEYTLRLCSIEYSKKHGHEICVMHLAGKNAFPKMTPEEILSNPKAMVGLSASDAVVITKLDAKIKERQKQRKILEIDRNGTVVLQDANGNIERFSERLISSERELLDCLNPRDAHDIGYRVGFKDGINVSKEIQKAKRNVFNFIKSFSLSNVIKFIR